MTFNNIKSLFQTIVTSHDILKGFGLGNLFEINGKLKPGLTYPLMWVVPLDSVPTEQTKQRKFNVLMLDLVKKDKSNRDEVWSDMEQCMDDLVKILRNESDDYELLNEPIYFPIDEDHGDWLTGWATDIVIQTDLKSNYCDIPSDMIPTHDNKNYVTITDQDGNIVATPKPGEIYYVIVASGIDEGGASQTYTMQVVDTNLQIQP